MNDKKLDELLALKKSVSGDFSKSTAEFSRDFFAQIEKQSRKRFNYLAWAAGFIILLGVTAFMLSLLKKPDVPYNPCAKLAETVRLFGREVAVIFLGNELVTGERDSSSLPKNFIDIDLATNGGELNLALACADNDSIMFDSPQYSGSIIASRCDDRTLVLDVDLTFNGKHLRTAIPVIQSNNNCYVQSELL